MFAGAINWEKAGNGSFVPVVFLFAHLKEFHPFYQGLVRSRKTDSVFKPESAILSEKIETALTERFKDKPAPSLPIPILANFPGHRIVRAAQMVARSWNARHTGAHGRDLPRTR